jgi:hypothetical protein
LRRIDVLGDLSPTRGARNFRLTWSPDATRLAIETENDAHTSVDTVIVGFDGSSTLVLRDTMRMAWSPDGRMIDIVNADGSDRRTIAVPTGDSGGYWFRWVGP